MNTFKIGRETTLGQMRKIISLLRFRGYINVKSLPPVALTACVEDGWVNIKKDVAQLTHAGLHIPSV